MDKSLRVRASGAKRRPNFSVEFKRQLVEQTLVSGASVAFIARENEINANLLFKWRRHYLKGAFGAPLALSAISSMPDAEATAFLPVSVAAELAPAAAPVADSPDPAENVCEVEFDRARLRIRGEVSPATLKLLIRELSR